MNEKPKIPNASRFAATINLLISGFFLWVIDNKYGLTTSINISSFWDFLKLFMPIFIIIISVILSKIEFRQAALEDRTLKAMINEKEWKDK
jgi:hypothetical protein